MRINVKRDPKIIMSNTNAIQRYFAWPTVARLQDGTLMAVASGFRFGHGHPFGKAVGVRSRDEGETWSRPEVIIDTGLDDRDSGILPFGEKGVIVTSFNNTPMWQRMQKHYGDCVREYTYMLEDECRVLGRDWRDYLGSTMAISYDGGTTFTDPIISPVTCPHGPCELNDGTILYVGNPLTKKEDINGTELNCVNDRLDCYAVSPEGEFTFRGSIEGIPGITVDEPHTIQLENGKIIVLIRSQIAGPYNETDLFTLYMSTSDDGGYTFTKPRQIVGKVSGAPAHMIVHSSGVLIAVYGHRAAPCGVYAAFSYDSGETWDYDNIVVDNEPSADFGYPASVELKNGDVLTVFYTRTAVGSEICVIKDVVWSFEK